MSMFTKLPSEFYDATAFDGFLPDRDFRLGTAKAMAWLSQLAYETDEPKKIEAILRIWKLRLVEEVISTELRSVLPMASTHAFVSIVGGHSLGGALAVVTANSFVSGFGLFVAISLIRSKTIEAASAYPSATPTDVRCVSKSLIQFANTTGSVPAKVINVAPRPAVPLFVKHASTRSLGFEGIKAGSKRRHHRGRGLYVRHAATRERRLWLTAAWRRPRYPRS